MNNELINFCDLYNIPINHLGSILKDPKVIPMIRGKAFEFSIKDCLDTILSKQEWKVSKPFLNPQLGSHDQDILIEHTNTKKLITIECKLAAKGRYKYQDNKSIFHIKCMRSRTLGSELCKRLALQKGKNEQSLMIHNDQYLPEDFDLVITSLANAFYSTDLNGIFVWNPSKIGQKFLNHRFGTGKTPEFYQRSAFNDIYVAKSSNLKISPENKILCTRKKCNDHSNCGFIPNYPTLIFNHSDNNIINNTWTHINNIETLLLDFI